jgi:hypothetical protein
MVWVFLLSFLTWMSPWLALEVRAEGLTLPSPRYTDHPPQYFPTSRELAAQERAASAASGVMLAQLPDAGGRPLPPLPTPVAVRQLAVANVHKEPVSLFKVVGGELKFVQKVATGEAVDVSVSAGDKLAATFGSAPHCANFSVKGVEGEVWLLRPAAATTTTAPPPAVVPCAPTTPAPSYGPPIPSSSRPTGSSFSR